MNKNYIIAIDGPSASGKSTVAYKLAKKLNMIYVDSGSFYRGITWYALKKNYSLEDSELFSKRIFNENWNFYLENNQVIFSVNGFRPNEELRSKEVRESVAFVAKLKSVREFVVSNLRKCKAFGSLVIEGRDIGSVVFPKTPHKFYLDADIKERAHRRYNELEKIGDNENADEVLKSLNKRDSIDINRSKDPLIIPSDAIIIDSTDLTLDEVIRIIHSKVNN